MNEKYQEVLLLLTLNIYLTKGAISNITLEIYWLCTLAVMCCAMRSDTFGISGITWQCKSIQLQSQTKETNEITYQTQLTRGDSSNRRNCMMENISGFDTSPCQCRIQSAMSSPALVPDSEHFWADVDCQSLQQCGQKITDILSLLSNSTDLTCCMQALWAVG